MHFQHHLPRYDPTHIQQIVDDLGLKPDVSGDRLQTALEIVRLICWPLQNFGPSLGGIQWCAQFMRQGGRKLILQPAHPFGLLPGGPFRLQEQLSIGRQCAQFRYVVRNLGGANNFSRGGNMARTLAAAST